MKLEITTSPKAVEIANMILGQGIKSIKENPDLKKYFRVTDADLKRAESFRTAVLESFLKPKPTTDEQQ